MEGQITHGSIFDDRELYGPERGANLKVRAQLMDRLISYVEENQLTQTEAAERFGTGQPRVSKLLHGQISKFTVDALLNMCAHAGIEVKVTFEGAYV